MALTSSVSRGEDSRQTLSKTPSVCLIFKQLEREKGGSFQEKKKATLVSWSLDCSQRQVSFFKAPRRLFHTTGGDIRGSLLSVLYRQRGPTQQLPGVQSGGGDRTRCRSLSSRQIDLQAEETAVAHLCSSLSIFC